MLDELRRLAARDEADASQRAELARALAELHWRKLRREYKPEEARQLLDELRALCRDPAADETQRFELARALGGAHWHAVRHGDATAAARLQTELRDLARRREAPEGQRWALAEAIANEIRYHSGPRGDVQRVEGLLRDLRRLARREHATELQRDALARALLHLHHAQRFQPGGGARAAEIRAELLGLAARPDAGGGQRLALLEALQDQPWKAGFLGKRTNQDRWIDAVRHAEHPPQCTERYLEQLCDTVVRMHAKVRRAPDDEFGDRLLDRLRVIAMRSDATIEQWLALATALCDGLWIAGAFGNRDLAEELVEIVDLLTGDVGASARQRMGLAGLLVGAHHRAVRSNDARLSKELLNSLWTWALRPEATAEERSVLAHGLELAHHHSRATRDKALSAKILGALRTLASRPDAGPAVGRALLQALEETRVEAEGAADTETAAALADEIERRRHEATDATDLDLTVVDGG